MKGEINNYDRIDWIFDGMVKNDTQREILESKRIEEVLKTDSIFVKFIQGFMKMTHF